MSVKAKVPTIRFKGFTNLWEQHKVSDIFDEVNSGNRLPKKSLTEGEIPYIIAKVTNNGEYMKVDKNTLDYHGNKMKLFMAPSITFSIDNPDAIFVQRSPFYTSNIMRVLHNRNLSLNQYIFFHHNIKKLTTYFNWSFKFSGPVVMNSVISFPTKLNEDSPNFEEIERIGSFFKNLDNLITLQQSKLLKLKNVKKAMLEKMFPRKGRYAPEISFVGFTDAWVQCKVKDILVQRIEHQKITEDAPLLAFSYAEGVINPEAKKSNKRDFIMTDKYNKIFSRTEMDDIIYNPANVIHGAIHRNKLGTGVVSPIYKIFKCEKVSSKFVGECLHTDKFIEEVTKFIEGTVIKLRTLSPDQFLDMSIEVPNSNDEQEKIGKFFQELDNLITLQQRKYEKLQNLKKACLEKMFV